MNLYLEDILASITAERKDDLDNSDDLVYFTAIDVLVKL